MVCSTFHLQLHRPRGSVIVPSTSVSRKQRVRELGGQGSGDYVQVGSLRDYLVLVEHQFSRIASQDVQDRRSCHASRKETSFFPAIIRDGVSSREIDQSSRPYAAICVLPILICINNNNYSRVEESRVKRNRARYVSPCKSRGVSLHFNISYYGHDLQVAKVTLSNRDKTIPRSRPKFRASTRPSPDCFLRIFQSRALVPIGSSWSITTSYPT